VAGESGLQIFLLAEHLGQILGVEQSEVGALAEMGCGGVGGVAQQEDTAAIDGARPGVAVGAEDERFEARKPAEDLPGLRVERQGAVPERGEGRLADRFPVRRPQAPEEVAAPAAERQQAGELPAAAGHLEEITFDRPARADRPQGAVGIVALHDRRVDLAAEPRAGAVGGDQQIERPGLLVALGERHDLACRLPPAGHRKAQPDLGSRRQRRVVKSSEHPAAVDAQRLQSRSGRAVAQLDQIPAAVGEGAEAGDRRAVGGDRCQEIEAGEDPLAARLEQEAGADRPDPGGPFEQGDAVSLAGEEDRRRAAAHTEAGDADP
jgi:hypothetical protein